MKNIILVFKKNKIIEYIHIQGRLLNVDETIKKLNILDYVQINENDLIDLCGRDFKENFRFIEKDSKGNLFFNEEEYLESKKDNEIH